MNTWEQPAGRLGESFGARLRGLFEEAWRRGRRRRRYALAGAVTLGALCAVVAAVSLTSGVTVPGLSTHGALSSETLPRAGDYSALAQVNGRLIVWGDGTGDSYSQPQASSDTARCQVADVVPTTMALIDVRRGGCADPALYGERVLMVETITPAVDHGVVESIRVSRTAPGGYRTGPVLARLHGCAACEPIFTYGDGALWIEVPSPIGLGTTHSELLQISQRTGRLARRWTLPALDRPWLTADRDGLWLAPSGFDGTPNLRSSRAETIDYQSLYRVTPGSRSPVAVYRIGGTGARWLLGSGHAVWLETATALRPHLVRLDGPSARPVYDLPAGPGSALFPDLGPSAHGIDSRSGVTTLGVTYTGGLEVLHPGPHAGRDKGPREIEDSPTFPDSVAGTLVGHHFFFLEPPATSTDDFTHPPRTAVSGSGVLYRVGDA